MTGRRCWGTAKLALCLTAVIAAGGLTAVTGAGNAALAAAPPTVNLKVLLIGEGPSDVTTAAWQAALTSEGVPFTLVTASGTAPDETVTLPALSSGSTGNYNGVVIADSPADYSAGSLSALDTYESSFGVRQVDGYMFPSPSLGVTEVTGGALDGTTGRLTAAGLAAFPELKGPVPFDAGTFGYGAKVNDGAPYTPFLTSEAGDVMAGVYQHPGTGDPQAGVSELALNFDYNASQIQWLLLAPGLINWLTQDTHLGLYRNYYDQDVDDVFITDNEWSQQFQCTPAATDPPDVGQGGVYKLSFMAANSVGTATQPFALTVDQAPAIISAPAATATHGSAFSFTFASVGYPLPKVTHTGTVPGLAYSSNADGTATLSGTPAAAGAYSLAITAKNSVGSASQAFLLTVS